MYTASLSVLSSVRIYLHATWPPCDGTLREVKSALWSYADVYNAETTGRTTTLLKIGPSRQEEQRDRRADRVISRVTERNDSLAGGRLRQGREPGRSRNDGESSRTSNKIEKKKKERETKIQDERSSFWSKLQRPLGPIYVYLLSHRGGVFDFLRNRGTPLAVSILYIKSDFIFYFYREPESFFCTFRSIFYPCTLFVVVSIISIFGLKMAATCGELSKNTFLSDFIDRFIFNIRWIFPRMS